MELSLPKFPGDKKAPVDKGNMQIPVQSSEKGMDLELGAQ